MSDEQVRWAALFDAAPEAYLVTDQAGVIADGNRSAADMLEIEPDRLRGMPLAAFVLHEHRKAFESALVKAQHGAPVGELGVSLKSQSDHEIKVVVRTSTVDASPPEILWSLRDVSDEYWARQRMRALEHSLELQRDITSLHILLADERTLDETVEAIAELANRMLPTSSVAISLRDPDGKGDVRLRFSSDDRTRAIASLLLERGQGPLWDAMATGQPVQTANLAVDARWPGLLIPPVSVLSLPLEGSETQFGTICLYGPEGIDPSLDTEVAVLLARQAATLIDNFRSYSDSQMATQNLRQAMATRSVIEQAKGMVMITRHVDENEAFEVLRHLSQRENRKLHDIAEEIVQRGQRNASRDK